MTMKSVLLASVLVLTPALAQAGKNDILVGLDQKVFFEANGGRIGPGGEDQLVVVDVSDPANPRIRATLKLSNSVVGPPTNLQITPDGRLALLASSVVTKETNGKWSNVPDDKLFVVDLDADPPKLIDTVTVGKQPSGLAISRDGKLALVANRAGKSVSVIAINGTKVRQVSEVPIDDEVAAVAITPDGKRGFVVKNLANRIGVLSIDGEKVKYDKSQDMPAGYTPYNVEVTPDGKYALSVNQGGGLSGNVDTIVTIDAAANPPRVIDQTAVGDSPEGMAIGSNGVWVAVPLIKGSASKHDRWSYTKNGSLVLMSLSSDGKLQLVNELPTGGVPEGVAFSPDSHYVYVGNYIDKNLQVYRIAGGKLADTGKTLSLPGQPASMRGLAR
ncbi:MAG: beta-propeller fold lactonase family protein [Alphaproteobacteria bacterium]|nr:beta-propeller fold lactonase family protein [Alphaproteobacteria bacterium]